MKRLSLLLMLIIPLSSIARTVPEPPDTVKLIDNPQKVVVSRTGDTTVIEVEKQTDYGKDLFTYNVTVQEADDSESSFDLEVPFGIGKDRECRKERSRLRTSVILAGHGYLGQRFNYYDKGNVKNSIEVGFREVIGIRWSRGMYGPSFSTGIGVGTQIYHARDGFAYAKVGSSLVLLPVEPGASVRSTRLDVFNFQLPLMLTVPIGRDVKFTLGAVGCFNTYARAHTEVSRGTTKIKTAYKGLQQRLFTAELTSSIGICDVLGVYASWSPMTLFQSPYGPRLKSWSLGAVINF